MARLGNPTACPAYNLSSDRGAPMAAGVFSVIVAEGREK